MNRLLAAILLLASMGATAQNSGTSHTAGHKSPEAYSQLRQGFLTPPDEARPRVWWHWMNGNISRDGLMKDMDWMYASGVRGFHIFDANMITPQIVDHRVSFLSDEWKDIFRRVIAHADSLGMEVTIASSPGFSSSGGPWVAAEDGMKKLTWRQTDLQGGKAIELRLPEPYRTTGVFQNIARKSKHSYYQDIAVLAVRIPQAERSLAELGAQVSSSSGSFSVEQLTNGDYADGGSLNAEEQGWSWIAYSFPEAVTVRAVTMRNGKTRGERHSNPADCVDSLQVSDDGVNYRTVAGIPLGCCTVQTFDIEPVSAKYFRLKHMNVPDSYHYSSDTWTYAPKKTRIQEFVLHSVSKVNHAEEKAEFGSAHDLRLFPTPDVGEDELSPLALDVTDKVTDGVLRWQAPEGRWRIIRLGCSLTGKQNHPASEEATGLEVDKLDPDAWSRYFHTYLDIMKEAAGGMMGQRGIQYVLEDSYEAEFQNWTPRMREEFKARRGYDCLPWMPALTGMILCSAEQTEQFLHDWRTTLGELFHENYALLTRIVRDEYGMKGCYIESHANGSIFPADGMSIKKTAAFPMGEMWIPGKVSSQNRRPEGTADIRESASVAHIYGQNYVAAESMTAIGLSQQAWTYCPENMKRTADLELKAGVNRFVLHDSAAQPRDDKFPGLGLGVYGHWFNRHECWADQAGVWMDYLARSSYMLSRGRNVADVLWYYGEETNVTSYYSRSYPQVPRGYEYDFLGADAFLNEISFEDGVFKAGSGAEFRVMYIDPNLTRFSPAVKAKIADLRARGAVICENLAGGLAASGTQPDVDYSGPETINFRHRSADGMEIYWLENASYEPLSKLVSFRVTGMVPQIWHPETGEVEAADCYEKDGRSWMELEFVSDDAFFVVFSRAAEASGLQRAKPAGRSTAAADGRRTTAAAAGGRRQALGKTTAAQAGGTSAGSGMAPLAIGGPWEVSFQEGRRAPQGTVMAQLQPLSESDDPGIRYFSGTATYRTSFKLKSSGGYEWLDLGSVKNIAEVYLNGECLGTLWKTPFRVKVAGRLRRGRNTLEVRVTNLWPNRLIGDAQPEETDPLTYTAFKFYKADDALLPSGLLGPVTLR